MVPAFHYCGCLLFSVKKIITSFTPIIKVYFSGSKVFANHCAAMCRLVKEQFGPESRQLIQVYPMEIFEDDMVSGVFNATMV